MKLIESLEEIRKYGRKWAKVSTKVVRRIPAEDILNLYIAANKFVPEQLQLYARLYDFPDYKGGRVRCLCNCAGNCSLDNYITIDFLEVLFADDIRFPVLLLYELCHTTFPNHKISFWELLDQKLKEVSIIDKDDNSRKKWLENPGLKDQDDYRFYDEPGSMYENVSAIKKNLVRRKICFDYHRHGWFNHLYDHNYESFCLAKHYQSIYGVSDDIFNKKYVYPFEKQQEYTGKSLGAFA